MNMVNEDAWITRNENEEHDSPPLKPAPWAFADIFLKEGGDLCEDFDVIVKRQDCTALMWAFIVTQNTFDRLTDLNQNILFMAKVDGKWNLVEKEKAEVFLTPWTVDEDRLVHYEACQELSEKLGRAVYPAFLAEEIE